MQRSEIWRWDVKRIARALSLLPALACAALEPESAEGGDGEGGGGWPGAMPDATRPRARGCRFTRPRRAAGDYSTVLYCRALPYSTVQYCTVLSLVSYCTVQYIVQ